MPKRIQIPTEEQIAKWEAQSVYFVRALGVIADCLNSNEPASGDWIRKKIGVGHEEWRDAGGPLIASAVFFCWENGFSEWHARTMVGLEEESDAD